MAQIDGRNPRPSVTLEEVAHVAGVSRATASRVVNGSPKVSPDVRRTVERAIDRLGYSPNRAARSLVTRRSDSVGVFIAEPTARLFNDPFFASLLRGVGSELAAARSPARPAHAAVGPRRDSRRAVPDGRPRGWRPAGVAARRRSPPRAPGRAAASRSWSAAGPSGTRQCSYVDVDNVHGARGAVEHLIEGGRRDDRDDRRARGHGAGDRSPRRLSRRPRGPPASRPRRTWRPSATSAT